MLTYSLSLLRVRRRRTLNVHVGTEHPSLWYAGGYEASQTVPNTPDV